MLLSFGILLFINTGFSQGKPKNLVHFCGTKNEVILDSLSKCAEVIANDPGMKIMSYTVKFEMLPGEIKTFNILGSAFTPELLRMLNEHKKYVNVIDIENILAEKEGQFIKLAPARFLFFF